MSGVWDRDEAAIFVEFLFGKHHTEIYAYLLRMLRERVDATYHWHWEIHPRLREIAGLELGTGLPVNPVSPEDAVEELLTRAAGAAEPAG